jgi:hypothetical protein
MATPFQKVRAMQHPKQPSSNQKSSPETNSLSGHAAPKWKWIALGFIFLLVVGVGVWNTGIVQNALAGPAIPLPRQSSEFALGMDEDAIIKNHPEIKKTIRKFNNDPLFQIVTLTTKDGLTDASSVDLLFYKKTLYFVSTMWDGDKAKNVALKDWASEYRRWNKRGTDSEPLGDQVLLKEWHFADPQTEMILRDLNYPEHIQRWQDIRDASNSEAQAAFAKYRLDGAG